jgi:hypothetical protein
MMLFVGQALALNSRMVLNWSECGRKLSRDNLRYYPEMFFEGLRKIRNGLSYDSPLVDRNLKSGLPECESGKSSN